MSSLIILGEHLCDSALSLCLIPAQIVRLDLNMAVRAMMTWIERTTIPRTALVSNPCVLVWFPNDSMNAVLSSQHLLNNEVNGRWLIRTECSYIEAQVW